MNDRNARAWSAHVAPGAAINAAAYLFMTSEMFISLFKFPIDVFHSVIRIMSQLDSDVIPATTTESPVDPMNSDAI